MATQNLNKKPPQAGKKTRKPSPIAAPETHPPVKHRKFVLTKVSHVRAELGRLYSEARNGLIDVSVASRLGNLLAILHRVIADSDLEKQVIELAERLEKIEGTRK